MGETVVHVTSALHPEAGELAAAANRAASCVMSIPPDRLDGTRGSTTDPDAVLVTAALSHLRHLDDPERHLPRDTDRVPRTKGGWVRHVLRALRDAGAGVTPPRIRTDVDADVGEVQPSEAHAALAEEDRASAAEMAQPALAAARRAQAARQREFVAAIEAVYDRYGLALRHLAEHGGVIVEPLRERHRRGLQDARLVDGVPGADRQRPSGSDREPP
ncbi:MAG TPA: hypothetical protein VGF17_14910 [Phytomonospora sp.]